MNSKIDEMNAVAIAQTLAHHGKVLEEFEKKVNGLTNMLQAQIIEIQNLKSLYHQSLVKKYGTGATS